MSPATVVTWIFVAVLAATALITLLALTGRIVLGEAPGTSPGANHHRYLWALFVALVLEVIIVSIAAYRLNLTAFDRELPKQVPINGDAGRGSSLPREHQLVSTRVRIKENDSAASGFVVPAGETRLFLARAVGPTLTEFGVSEALYDPVLKIFAGRKLIGENHGWTRPDAGSTRPHSPDDIARMSASVGAFELNADSLDAALVIELGPGAYVIEVSSKSGISGVVLIELYRLR